MLFAWITDPNAWLALGGILWVLVTVTSLAVIALTSMR